MSVKPPKVFVIPGSEEELALAWHVADALNSVDIQTFSTIHGSEIPRCDVVLVLIETSVQELCEYLMVKALAHEKPMFVAGRGQMPKAYLQFTVELPEETMNVYGEILKLANSLCFLKRLEKNTEHEPVTTIR